MKKFIPLLGLLLVGCGDDEPEVEKPPLQLDTPVEQLIMPESSKKEFSFPVKGVGLESPDVSYTFDGHAIVKAKYEQGEVQVVFETFPIVNEGGGTLKVEMKTEDEEAIVEVPVIIENTSAKVHLSVIDKYKDQVERVFSYPQEQAIFKKYVEYGIASGDLNEDEAEAFNTKFKSMMDSLVASNCYFCTKSGLEQTVNEYYSAEISESELKAVAVSLEDRLYTQGQLLRQLINDVSIVTDMPELGNTNFFTAEDGSHSQFIGHPELGAWTDEGFVFSKVYSVVDEVLTSLETIPEGTAGQKTKHESDEPAEKEEATEKAEEELKDS
tara:strand:- start:9496 stop:10473 length:978 start_codon:yes stop_codon:yes gene_type:complete